MTDPQFFTTPDGTEMAIITLARYKALLAAEEEIEDIAAAEEGRASLAAEGGIPIEVSTAIANYTHPIVAWRKHRGMTQAQLAEAADLTQAAVARLEKTPPGAGRNDTLGALAKALDAPRWTLELHRIAEGKLLRGRLRARGLVFPSSAIQTLEDGSTIISHDEELLKEIFGEDYDP